MERPSSLRAAGRPGVDWIADGVDHAPPKVLPDAYRGRSPHVAIRSPYRIPPSLSRGIESTVAPRKPTTSPS